MRLADITEWIERSDNGNTLSSSGSSTGSIKSVSSAMFDQQNSSSDSVRTSFTLVFRFFSSYLKTCQLEQYLRISKSSANHIIVNMQFTKIIIALALQTAAVLAVPSVALEDAAANAIVPKGVSFHQRCLPSRL